VSSTLGKLAAERRAVARAIPALRLTSVMFEAGARPHPGPSRPGTAWSTWTAPGPPPGIPGSAWQASVRIRWG